MYIVLNTAVTGGYINIFTSVVDYAAEDAAKIEEEWQPTATEYIPPAERDSQAAAEAEAERLRQEEIAR